MSKYILISYEAKIEDLMYNGSPTSNVEGRLYFLIPDTMHSFSQKLNKESSNEMIPLNNPKKDEIKFDVCAYNVNGSDENISYDVIKLPLEKINIDKKPTKYFSLPLNKDGQKVGTLKMLCEIKKVKGYEEYKDKKIVQFHISSLPICSEPFNLYFDFILKDSDQKFRIDCLDEPRLIPLYCYGYFILDPPFNTVLIKLRNSEEILKEYELNLDEIEDHEVHIFYRDSFEPPLSEYLMIRYRKFNINEVKNNPMKISFNDLHTKDFKKTENGTFNPYFDISIGNHHQIVQTKNLTEGVKEYYDVVSERPVLDKLSIKIMNKNDKGSDEQIACIEGKNILNMFHWGNLHYFNNIPLFDKGEECGRLYFQSSSIDIFPEMPKFPNAWPQLFICYDFEFEVTEANFSNCSDVGFGFCFKSKPDESCRTNLFEKVSLRLPNYDEESIAFFFVNKDNKFICDPLFYELKDIPLNSSLTSEKEAYLNDKKVGSVKAIFSIKQNHFVDVVNIELNEEENENEETKEVEKDEKKEEGKDAKKDEKNEEKKDTKKDEKKEKKKEAKKEKKKEKKKDKKDEKKDESSINQELQSEFESLKNENEKLKTQLATSNELVASLQKEILELKKEKKKLKKKIKNSKSSEKNKDEDS